MRSCIACIHPLSVLHRRRSNKLAAPDLADGRSFRDLSHVHVCHPQEPSLHRFRRYPVRKCTCRRSAWHLHTGMADTARSFLSDLYDNPGYRRLPCIHDRESQNGPGIMMMDIVDSSDSSIMNAVIEGVQENNTALTYGITPTV